MPIYPQQLVILDRDGVINEDSDAYIKSVNEWIPYSDSIDAIARLSQSGYSVAIATNQSGIARGYYDETELAKMHARLTTLVETAGGRIAHVAYCPHGPDDNCTCRKPLPGLLHEIQRVLGLSSLQGSWMVGDSLRDLQAGHACGCRLALVKTGKGAKTAQKDLGLNDVLICTNLTDFTDKLLSGRLD
ncbi:D-glycero-beta-D-manno-heptose 1,7-bisphosphate 7-phosphatase [Vreelandella profundi]|uniref:D-glycero-beta-D-manno-heptose 1,7-bisphosphate 7-phosphatase n=1 Tax=Vreelandella profundi TaxID=2852117 RepID=UPI001EEFDA64|nr:D-glycero-beta-D-manno-heptose 1,7-bisphosphate 7-phosphatase [Halomonas profundi]